MSDTREHLIFAPGIHRIVLGVLTLSILATVGSLIWGQRLIGPEPTGLDSYTHGPLGHKATLETLEALGVRVHRWRGVEHGRASYPVWFIAPALRTSEAAGGQSLADVLTERAEEGFPSVVVLPKWELANDDPPVAQRLAVSDAQAVVDAALWKNTNLIVVADETPRSTVSGLQASYSLELQSPQMIEGADPQDIIVGAQGRALIVRKLVGSSITYIVSDPDLLSNYSHHRADHAILLRDFVEAELAAKELGFDEVFHGHGETFSLVRALGGFPGVLLVIQALMLATAVYLYGVRRFGPAAPMLPPYGRGPKEVIAVAASVLAAGQPVGVLVVHYVTHVVGDLAQRAGLGSDLPMAQKASLVDEMARLRSVVPQAKFCWDSAIELSAKRRQSVVDAVGIARKVWAFRNQVLQVAASSADQSRRLS